MIASAPEHAAGSGGLAPAFAAARTRLGLIALLLALAAAGWWWTVDEMQGMDGGPWTDLGTLAWFVGVWVVMMAAMMFPSVAPTVALYSRMTKSRSPVAPLLFTSGYLVAWTSVGVLAFAVATSGGRISGDLLAWDRAGRWVAGATLIAAAVYELTPLKDVCLGKCRSPLGFLLGSWRSGRSGALQMGARHGAWCIGCCWALMASLFALGVMSVVWMAVVAGLIAFEKLIPSRRTATYVTAAILLVLGVLLIAAPDTIPALTVPGSGSMSPDEPDEPLAGHHMRGGASAASACGARFKKRPRAGRSARPINRAGLYFLFRVNLLKGDGSDGPRVVGEMSDDGRDPTTGQFQKGWKGGPGRQLGSRHKLEATFIQAFADDFSKHGADAIERVRRDDPGRYLRIAAGLMPKDVNLHAPPAHLSLEEISEKFRDLVARANRAVQDRAAQVTHAEPAPRRKRC